MFKVLFKFVKDQKFENSSLYYSNKLESELSVRLKSKGLLISWKVKFVVKIQKLFFIYLLVEQFYLQEPKSKNKVVLEQARHDEELASLIKKKLLSIKYLNTQYMIHRK